MYTRNIKAAIVPELNGSPKLLTNKSSVALNNLKVFGSNNLKIPIRIIIPITFAEINPTKGFRLYFSKIFC